MLPYDINFDCVSLVQSCRSQEKKYFSSSHNVCRYLPHATKTRNVCHTATATKEFICFIAVLYAAGMTAQHAHFAISDVSMNRVEAENAIFPSIQIKLWKFCSSSLQNFVSDDLFLFLLFLHFSISLVTTVYSCCKVSCRVTHMCAQFFMFI